MRPRFHLLQEIISRHPLSIKAQKNLAAPFASEDFNFVHLFRSPGTPKMRFKISFLK